MVHHLMVRYILWRTIEWCAIYYGARLNGAQSRWATALKDCMPAALAKRVLAGEACVLVFAGRLSREKRVELLLETVPLDGVRASLR